jgi:predicted AAA+ superfamily ATPase
MPNEYINRAIEGKVFTLLKHFPAVAILGPRQSGKTTLVKEICKQLFKESIYLDLENPIDQGALQHPMEFFNSVSHKTVIIDEIQRKPELFPILRASIDQSRIPARFILLGSASQDLLFLSNETLAGRIVYVELAPFNSAEVRQKIDFRTHWLRGGFPDPCLTENAEIRSNWYNAFISAYTERDLRMLGLRVSPLIVNRLLQMLPAFQGGILNYSSLGKSVGISTPTVKDVISYFERSFIVRLLAPYHANLQKRLVKSPKIYIRDSGIANALLFIRRYEDLLHHPHLGLLWEGYVVEEIIIRLGDEFRYYFYRTADGTECDLLVFRGEKCIAAIDVKFAAIPGRSKSMTITMQDLRPDHGFFVIPECPEPYTLAENITVVNPDQLIEIFRVA